MRSEEQFQQYNDKADTCGHFHRLFYMKDGPKYYVSTFRCRCKSMACKHCSTLWKRNLMNNLEKFLERKTIRFLTLTFRYTEGMDMDMLYKKANKDWNYFLLIMRRRYHKKFQFVKFLEFTKNLAPHFHILIDCYIAKDIIQDVWYEVTGDSYKVEISRKKSHRSCYSYALKYATKTISRGSKSHDDAVRLHYVYSLRRFSCSRLYKVKKWINKFHNFISHEYYYEDFLYNSSEIKRLITSHIREKYKDARNIILNFENLIMNLKDDKVFSSHINPKVLQNYAA